MLPAPQATDGSLLLRGYTLLRNVNVAIEAHQATNGQPSFAYA